MGTCPKTTFSIAFVFYVILGTIANAKHEEISTTSFLHKFRHTDVILRL
jgi:hypothetical protein